MNIIDIFVIVCAIITSAVSITGGKKQAGLAGKGLFYLFTSSALLILGLIMVHMHAAFVTSLVFCIAFSIALIMAFIDIEKEKQKIDELREKLEKARKKH